MKIDVEPLARAVSRLNRTWTTMAWECGYTRKGYRDRRRGDPVQLKRALGLAKYYTKSREGKIVHYTNKRIDYDRALHICERLGIDPVEVGL